MEEKVCAILVLYNPDTDMVSRCLHSISQTGVQMIYIIDNGDESKPHYYSQLGIAAGVKYFFNGSNQGIAAAQNKGIKCAVEDGFDYCIFFDHDTIVQDKALTLLLVRSYKNLIKEGYKVGAIGPRTIDRKTQTTYKAKVDKGNYVKGFSDIIEIKQIISSGTLIDVNVFKETGIMMEELFIDLVDFEWCWRSRAKGYHHFILESVSIEHEFGLDEHRFFSFKMSLPSPFRCYYIFRNYFILLRKGYVPAYWKMSNMIKLSIKFFYYPLLVRPRLDYFRNIITGITDGIFYTKKGSNENL